MMNGLMFAQRRNLFVGVVTMVCAVTFACSKSGIPTIQVQPIAHVESVLDPDLVDRGRQIFRHETFGNEAYWTDTLRLHEVIERSVSPIAALEVGLKVDADVLPRELKAALAAKEVDLSDPAVTVALLKLNAVVGLVGTVQTVGRRQRLTHLGITCALCHSTVDNSMAPGIGTRMDGHPNRDLNVGAIVALSPAVPAAVKDVLKSWGPGKYDPRNNRDGGNTPLVIPPAYGLRNIAKGTFTADGTISYWNAYVAVTQMHGRGNFRDERLGLDIVHVQDLVTPKLPALRAYQFSLLPPTAPAGSFDTAAAERGRTVFNGAGRCATCHLPESSFTDINKAVTHAPAETGMSAAYAARTITKRYRTTPLRGVWDHPPYFHDGSAATLDAVVQHYNRALTLRLTAQQEKDLVQYLKSL